MDTERRRTHERLISFQRQTRESYRYVRTFIGALVVAGIMGALVGAGIVSLFNGSCAL